MATALELRESTYRVYFTTRGWNDIVRAGVYAAGEDWVTLALPKRFTRFAYNLGYPGKKDKAKPPLVDTGRLRAGLLAKAYAEARATSSQVSLTLRLPTPSMLDYYGNSTGMTYFGNRTVAGVLRHVTDGELDRMATVMTRTMQALIDGAEITTSRRGKERRTLTTTQRASIAHTIKPQRSLASAHTERIAS